MRNQGSFDPFLDESLCNAAVQSIDVLNDSGLDGPFAAQLLVELVQCSSPGQPGLLVCPDALERDQFPVSERLEIFVQICNRARWYAAGITALCAAGVPERLV